MKVIDFGIAKAAGKVTKTQAGILKGKFGYMSPEQIRGLPLDRRSDVFAIGVCLYELLTGERLFVGESDFQVLEKVRKAEVLPPSTYNRKIPEALERIVLKALAKDAAGPLPVRERARRRPAALPHHLGQHLQPQGPDAVHEVHLRRGGGARAGRGWPSTPTSRRPRGCSPRAGRRVPVLARTTGPILAAVPTPPSTPAVVKSASLPRLTAAAPQAQSPRDDEGTLLVDGSEVLASVEAVTAARPAHRRRGARDRPRARLGQRRRARARR